MKNIIVATDFSEEGNNALEYAVAAAADSNFKLIVFNLQQISIHVLNARVSAEMVGQSLKLKEKQLEDICEKIRRENVIDISPYFATGDFFDALNDCIKVHNAEMLVMGMRSKSLEQDLLGNKTTAAIGKLKIPVLAVPATVKYAGIKNILFACDVLRGLYIRVLSKVRDVARHFNADVEVFHVSDTVNTLQQDDERFTLLQEGMEGVSYFYKSVSSDRIIAAISEEVLHSNADILIMVPQKHGFWGSMVHRSKTRILASGNSIPLLSIPIG